METQTVSLILIGVGVAIILIALYFHARVRRLEANARRSAGFGRRHRASLDEEIPEELDPLFATAEVAEAAPRSPEVEPSHRRAALPESPPPEAMSTGPAPLNEEREAVEPQSNSPVRRHPPREVTDPERIVVLNVMGRHGWRFKGPALLEALANAGLEHGDMDIFHYYAKDDPHGPPLFSVANVMKPGSFDPSDMAHFTTTGLSLFMVPSNDLDDLKTFDTMLKSARQLAQELGGEVCDARRSLLTKQAVTHMREQIQEWCRKARVGQ
ncbi:MAG TPA: cell division protein ZipA [Gammaproteobacteria bacterium]|nr:cell division protein ZipA [Gammaproteobacteria bacterium]